MNRCPITYECTDNKYSKKGLALLSKSLNNLKDFPYSDKRQIELAIKCASKLSIQGVQPKLSVVLKPSRESFEIVENKGKFIIKPPHDIYDEVPQNEDLTMRLASTVGIEVPLHGMIYNIDQHLSYFIKRFDRIGSKKVALEDFSQLLGYSRDTKYESSMEKIVTVIDKHCTFPIIEKQKIFRIVLFNFLVGNEDMHLKNFSLITRNNIVELSPAYDLLNTTIIMNAKEEIALPLNGKKSNLKKEDFFDYFGMRRLGISQSILNNEHLIFKNILGQWNNLIKISFLSTDKKNLYKDLLLKRWNRLN